MIQLVVEGVYLDLYDNDPPKITLAFDSFESFQPQSTYSQSFRVPATNNNYKFFKSAYEVNGLDFDITIKRSAKILYNGAEFDSGELRLNKIYKSGDNKIDYEVIFFGTTRDFVSKLGNKKLNELDLNELTHLQSMSFVKQSWLAYPATKDYNNNNVIPTLFSGFLNGNILYPLVDFGNRYDENESVREVSISIGDDQHITNKNTDPELGNYVPIANRIWANRFKPMVRAKYLFDKIFNEAGFTYTSNFLDSTTNPFRRLYVSAWGNEDTPFCAINSWNTRLVTDEPYSINSANTQVPAYQHIMDYDTTVYDYSDAWDEDDKSWASNRPGTNDIRIISQLYGNLTNTSGGQATGGMGVRILKNGLAQPLNSNGDLVQFFGPEENIDFYYDEVLSLNNTDKIQVAVYFVNPGTLFNVNIGIFSTITEGEINIASLLEDEYKQIDFIKDILTTFKLVMVPDRNNENNFLIETWKRFIGDGDLYNWSDKLDLSKDMVIEPLFLEQKSEINFTTKDEGDWLNNLNKKTFKENFGDLIVDANNDLLKDSKKIEVNYAATPTTEINGASNDVGSPTEILVGRNNMLIPHIYNLEPGRTRALKKPIKPKTRFLFYNGMKYTGQVYNLNSPFTNNTTASWYWREDNNTAGNSLLFPMVSPYQYMSHPYEPGANSETNSINLTWQAENGYLQLNNLSPSLSLYDFYWKDYISLLYNKDSRRLIAYFILDYFDLYNFNFNDVIFVKDAYYYVEKIENIQLDKKESVRVSLIKLLNYTPDSSGFIPPFDSNIWNEFNEKWDITIDTWDD